MEKVKPVSLNRLWSGDYCAQECSGDIMGDLNSRRGRVQGMTPGARISDKAQVQCPKCSTIINIELDHRCARIISHAVLAL